MDLCLHTALYLRSPQVWRVKVSKFEKSLFQPSKSIRTLIVAQISVSELFPAQFKRNNQDKGGNCYVTSKAEKADED